MAAYLIRVTGCAAATLVIADLTADELAAVQRVAELVKAASSYSCEPTIRVVPVAEAAEDDLETAMEQRA